MAHTSDAIVQDFYPDDFAHCYGCGRHNAHGLHVQTHWNGEEGIAQFVPQEYHCAIPGFVYGGLLASLIDCHAMGTASAAVLHAAGQRVGDTPSPRYVTGQLNVTYRKPTPLGPVLELRAWPRSIAERKVILDVTLSAAGIVTVTGEVVAVRLPEGMR